MKIQFVSFLSVTFGIGKISKIIIKDQMKNNMRNKNLLYALLIGCALNSCGSNPATGDETFLKEIVLKEYISSHLPENLM